MIILIVLIAFRITLHLRLQADDRLQGKLIIFELMITFEICRPQETSGIFGGTR